MAQQIVVVGGGTMGTGIAYVSAFAGHTVTVVEPDDVRAAVLAKTLEDTASSAVGRGKLTTLDKAAMLTRIRRVRLVAEVASQPDIAIETVSERLELKLAVLREISALNAYLVGTNTSSLSIDLLATAARVPERFLGTHFFNPVWSFKFVELIRGEVTSEATLNAARAFVASIEKECIVVRNVPGFATSRLDLIASLEAMRMYEEGTASVEDIDRAAVLAFHHPVGPLRLSDIVGLDVRLDIARSLEQTYGARYAPPQILIDKVARGELGQKSGQGFFAWPEKLR